MIIISSHTVLEWPGSQVQIHHHAGKDITSYRGSILGHKYK